MALQVGAFAARRTKEKATERRRRLSLNHAPHENKDPKLTSSPEIHKVGWASMPLSNRVVNCSMYVSCLIKTFLPFVTVGGAITVPSATHCSCSSIAHTCLPLSGAPRLGVVQRAPVVPMNSSFRPPSARSTAAVKARTIRMVLGKGEYLSKSYHCCSAQSPDMRECYDQSYL